MNFRLLFHAACDEPQRFRRNPDFASLHPGYDFNRRCEPTGRANARPMTGSAKQSIKPRRKNGLLRRFAPRNDDTDGKRKWQKQPQQGVPPPVNACAEKSRSRSMCPRAGPGMIIRRRAGAPMARGLRHLCRKLAQAFAHHQGQGCHHALRGQGRKNRAQLLRALRHAAILRAHAFAAHGEHPARALFRPNRPPAALSRRDRGIAGMGLYRRAAGAAQGFSRRGMATLEKEEAH